MSLYVLDTDTVTLLLRGHPTVCKRSVVHAPQDLAITIVTVEEILSGWYSQIRRAKKDDSLLRAYSALQEAVEFTARVQILPFDRGALSGYKRLRISAPRMGTNDLRIAAIVQERTATLVTCNTRDFKHLPGMRVEDWS
jgi:tRNA(fMet)-specific endonuclease VapC